MGYFLTRAQYCSSICLPCFFDPVEVRLRLVPELGSTVHSCGPLPADYDARFKARDHPQHGNLTSRLPLAYVAFHPGSLYPQLQGVPVWLQEDEVYQELEELKWPRKQ